MLTQGYNSALATVLTGLGVVPGIQIVEFNLYKTLNDIVADPSASGLSDVTDACISPSNPPFVCKNPDSYLFWDGIHPTTVAHGILAQAVAKTLQ